MLRHDGEVVQTEVVEAADADLVDAARDGSALAFEPLVRRYRDRVYGLAYRITNDHADAQDVAQEAFITAWRNLDDLRESAAVRTWIFRIATSAALTLLRKRRRTVPVPDMTQILDQAPDGLGAPGAPDPADHGETAAKVAALGRALLALTPRQRAVWVLIEIDGASYQEAAEATGYTADAVRGQLFRARARLAEVMQPWR